MPKAEPTKVEPSLTFDATMRRLMNVPPPPSGKKATRTVSKPKKRKHKSR